MTKPYQFAFHENVSKTPPRCEIWEKCKKKNLSREEKNSIFHQMQGNSGKEYYRYAGWVYPIRQFMKKFIVKYTYESGSWKEITAFDKTCIRSSWHTNSHIHRIKELSL